MPKLDPRLKAVASRLQSRTHADIGSDHGHLLLALLRAGRIEKGIAIENKRQPFANSVASLNELNAEVRFADGLDGLQKGEADSLSICGMGAEVIVKILTAHPDRVPPIVILQPNRKPELVRMWGLNQGFCLVDETVTDANWSHHVLLFHQSDLPVDPAYDDVDREAALLFGPLIMKRRAPTFVTRLREEQQYMKRLDRLSDEAQRRLSAIERAL